MITELNKNEIFVFGSNIAGIHSGGAALQAWEHFGAEEGVGEGPTGQCYAFPTLTRSFSQVSNTELKASRLKFYRYANNHPELTFILTKVGCGIAGFPEEKMKKLFVNAPTNVIKPKGWQ